MIVAVLVTVFPDCPVTVNVKVCVPCVSRSVKLVGFVELLYILVEPSVIE